MRNFLRTHKKIIVWSTLLIGLIGGLLTVLTLGAGGVFFDGEPLVLSVLVLLTIGSIVISFWSITARQYISVRMTMLVMTIITLVWLLLAFPVLQGSLAGVLRGIVGVGLMVCLMSLIGWKRNSFERYRKSTPGSIVVAGQRGFGIGCAALCALLVSSGMILKPLTCEGMYDWFDTVAESPVLPIQAGQNWLENIGQQDVGGVLKSLQVAEDLAPDQEEDAGVGSRLDAAKGVMVQAKQSLIDETLQQRTIVTKNICELVLDQISVIRKTAARNISIVVLLFLLFSPVVTVWFSVIGLITQVFLHLLTALGVYRKQKKLVVVEELK